MTWLATVALLCQVGDGPNMKAMAKQQLKCQKAYIQCVHQKSWNKKKHPTKALAKCVLERGQHYYKNFYRKPY